MSEPQLECDLVMKGGVTSGIVYPMAMLELGKSYRFRGVGGTSAGAMAAAFVAAAQYGQLKTTGTGINGLERASQYLGAKGNLSKLFRAHGFWLRLGFLLARKPTLLILPALLLFGLGLYFRDYQVTVKIAAASLIAAFLTVVSGVRLVLDALKVNGYGFCRGSAGGSSKDSPELTDWLHRTIQELSGESLPLTFGNLESSGVDLKLVTTNLHHGRPYTFPYDRDALFYKSEELRRYFPGEVIQFMDGKSTPDEKFPEFRKLPNSAALPIVVIARASGSFPLLLSAIPFYAVPYDKKANDGKQLRPELCLFSDGGICSNFPFHFFDAPIPSRPTFGLNLENFGPGREPSKNQQENVYRPATNAARSTYENWCRFEGLPGFLGAIFNAAQNWRDNGLLRLPGYRDRVSPWYMAPSEGGLNLDMPVEVIEGLRERGAAAGRKLRDEFATGRSQDRKFQTTWRNHCWVRYRTAMNLLSETLESVTKGLDQASYRELLNQTEEHGYDFNAGDLEKAKGLTEELIQFASQWDGHKVFRTGVPRPRPRLAISPDLIKDENGDD